MRYPIYRPRRLRQTPQLRALVRETDLSVGDFIMPLFVRTGARIRQPIKSMPGQFQFSVDELVREAEPMPTTQTATALPRHLFAQPQPGRRR